MSQDKTNWDEWAIQPCSNGGKILVRGEYMNQIVPTADAVLMHAAPEMLELLSELTEAREGKQNVYGCAAKALDKDFIARAEAVVAKARAGEAENSGE